jgi:hypothetical protein
MSAEQERAAFEAWFSDGGESPRAIERDSGCGYKLAQAQSAWVAWQEAWQARAQMAQAATTRITWDDQGRRLVNGRLDAEEQEPVAWLQTSTGCIRSDWGFDKKGYEPLYTAPPARQPLTDEQISDLLTLNHGWLELARAIERHHGIKGEQHE